ncbi:MAG: CoA pyrophosphatase, partial [Bacteroidales bacterium]|nr:CoA pyrophosphatase [Bacteroidales bacterium]
ELKKPLPGADFQNKMAPLVRGDFGLNLPFRKAGVLILIYSYNEVFYTLFIKRTEYNGAHSGQISFPGGMYEDEDITLDCTAIRETEEETGLNRNLVQIIGRLTPLHIPISNTEVHPFVGFYGQKPVFLANPLEVQFIIEAQIELLIDPFKCKRKKNEYQRNRN